MNNLIGQNLGPYLILEQIGAGGMATVYKAYQPAVERDVAIKVIAAHFAQDEEFLKRFSREAKAVAQLEHAHILPVYDYGEAEGSPYLVMRYLEAGTLKDRMTQDRLSLSEINRIVGQVGSALDYAHRMGVIHRDVKPANILLDAEGNAYLTDFGLAKMIEASARLTGTGVGIGTPVYMSPEQGQATKVDSRTDVYSLGVMLYEMVTGRVPYEAETPLAVVLKHINEPLPLPRSVRPNLPEGVERVILRALAKEPGDRYQTAGEMVRALDGAVRAAEAEARTEPVIKRTTPVPGAVRATPQAKARRLRLPRWVGWVAGGAVALAAFFLILSRVPLRVQISGGQLEVVRVAEETVTPSTVEGPTPTPTDISTVAPHINPTDQRGQLVNCDDDLCVLTADGNSVPLGLSASYTQFSRYTWAPDGSQIAFSACLLGNEGYCEELYVADLHNGAVMRLPRQGENHHPLVPAWSPNGEWIAYHDSGALSVVRPDGTDHREIVPHPYCPTNIAWSPDSAQLAWFAHWCDEEETSPALLLVVNFDGSDMQLLWTRDDANTHGSDVAFSPDGAYLAVRFDDGSVYQVDPGCAPGPDGCDESSRTEMDDFPEHWLHTYWPQWEGEEVVALTPADQARTFAAPILAAIAGRAPDYDDDFSNPDGRWGAGPLPNGESGYQDGEYFIATNDGCAGVGPATLPQLSDFVLEIEGWAVSGDVSAWQVHFRTWQDSEQGTNGAYVANVGSTALDTFRIGEGEGPLSTGQTLDGLRLQSAPSDRPPQGDRLRIVARGSEFAIYLNGVPALYVNDPSYSQRWETGSLELVVCRGETLARVHFDNFKIWDISDLELPTSTADQARAFAEPILAAIADRPPDYEDDFGNSGSGWGQGAIVDPTGWEEGERGYADGEYYIVAPPARIRPQMPEQPMTCASGWPADLDPLSDMVLEIEGRFVKVENGNRHVNFRQWDDPDTGVGGKYEVMFEPSGTVWIGKVHPEEGHQVLAQMQGLPVQAGSETNRLQIVAVSPQIAVYVNGEPTLFFTDPDFDERYQSGLVSLVACNSADTPMEVRWDNLRIWDISGLELPSAEAPPAPTADATLYGCQPGERLLYLNDFEDGEPSFGPWVAEEAPEGGLALHAVGTGMFTVLPERNPVAETRTAFRLRPGGGEWSVEFRVQREPRYSYYNLSGLADQMRLNMQVEDAQSLLASAGPLTPNRWALVEIVWEDRYTLVVRVDGAEVIRHVLPEESVLEKGGINLDQPWASDEAWFDDIVVCGE